jgi:hypothetical protein
MLVDGERRAREHHERVAVGLRVRDLRRGQHGGGTGLVLDHHGLAKHLRKLVGIEPHYDVHTGACPKRHHDGDRLRWIVFSERGRWT